ncbi:MAG: hypothetical protein MUF35_10450 [Candidatus Nanopelagicales bacterium]|jgi:hypothetical protein|nr:hypothetical protein [Candidatus Nanopelagicales bacterium]
MPSPIRSLTALAATATLLLGLGATAAPGAPPTSVPTGSAGPATVVAVRAAHHPGFDRLVLEVDGPRAPAATVRYVKRLIHDASGRVVPVPGDRTLRIVLQNAQAHDEAGRTTVRLNRTFGLPVVLATRAAGDFEGVVTVGVGLSRKAAFQVRRYSNPGRLVIDVSTRAVPASRCVYLVRGLQYHGPIYTGAFIVARVRDGRVSGTTGAFYSEFVALRGRVSATRTSLQVRDDSGTWRPWSQRWRPDRRTFVGWMPVTKAQMRLYSGGGVPVAGQPCA